MGLLTLGLIFVQDAKKYGQALKAVVKDAEIICLVELKDEFLFTHFNGLIAVKPAVEIEDAFAAIKPDTVAKTLFKSCSTGLPKGVINTDENIVTNWQQITKIFPFIKAKRLEYIDWLPIKYTVGGNHNFGIALYNGNTLYIDYVNPTPEGITTTVAHLKERKPAIYFNVPKKFEEVISHFKSDEQLH